MMNPNNAIRSRARELSPAKRDLLEKRLRGDFKDSARVQLIPRRPQNTPAPLSFAQQRLWVIDQMEPGSDAYHLPIVLELEGEIDPLTLEKCLHEIIRRHEVLRATFPAVDGQPAQVISPFAAWSLPVTDLRGQPPGNREAQAQQLLREEARRTFDLARGPLARWRLFRLAEQKHLLALTLHHIVSDGWSIWIFFRELQSLYEAFAKNTAAPLPELPIQYGDYSFWQRKWMQGPVLQQHLSYWRKKLAGAPASMALPTASMPPSPSLGRAAHEEVVFGKDFVEALSGFSQQHGASPFMVLLAALSAVLSKWTQQSDLVIGTVVAGRTRREIENLIGCFMNFLPLRTKFSGDPTALEILAQVKATVLEAYAHQDCPFEKIVEAINPARKPHRNPLYNVAFLMQNFARGDLRRGQLAAKLFAPEPQAALLDLRFLAEEREEGLSLLCEYDTGLFAAETMKLLVNAFGQTLEAMVRQPAKRLSEFEWAPGLGAPAAVQPSQPGQRIAVTATFTAEPLAEPLRFWMEKLELPVAVEFAPYNQVFQQLLDPTSLLAGNQRGLNVVLLRLEDWERVEAGAQPAGPLSLEERFEPPVRQLALALKTAASRSSTPWLVCLCPASKRDAPDGARSAFFARMEKELAVRLSGLAGVYLVTPAELLGLYPVAEYDDPHGDELGRVPYAPLFFAALGTLVARKFHALKRVPKKVIVLDCDQTLWTGVCGEDGPQGVKMDPPRRALQQFMRAQLDAGMLLCLCSKNTEEDVRAVFECCPDMPLRLEHFAAWRINWRPKSENLRSLAEELRLGLDSFVLVDDNPVECAEAEANCPEVLTLPLPEDPQAIPRFLNHAWVFDHLKLSAEDRSRTALYQQNRQRENLQAQSLSLGEFLAGLNLKAQIEPPTAGQLTRIAQLTERTNQFNFTTRRRSEAEIQQLWRGTQLKMLAVSVRDRFGDYGLVGVTIYGVSGEALEVDTFLLSCRALGKGIEHRMLARLGQIAQTQDCRWLEIKFLSSARNKPALDFLETIGAAFRRRTNHGLEFRFPTEFARAVTFNPERADLLRAEKAQGPVAAPAASAGGDGIAVKSSQISWTALHAYEPGLILEALQEKTAPRTPPKQNHVPPRTEIERELCRAWEQLLRIERAGIDDDFFELGGSSLMAVQLLAQVRKITGKNLPLSTLFQAPTVERLANLLEDKPASSSSLVALKPEGSKSPLILVHGAGGGILWGYANLAPHLGSDQPVYAIEPPAATQETLSVETMASHYIRELRALQPAGPYYLGGYCFGGYVAYEMARQLDGQGEKVARVVLIDSAAPNGSYEKTAWWRLSFLPKFIFNLSCWLEDFFRLEPKARRNFVQRQVSVVKKKLLARVRRPGDKSIHLEEYINAAELPEHELSLWRVHLRAGAEYVPQPYSGRVALVRTRAQPLLCSFDPTYGWGELAAGGVDVRIVPGSHENIFMEPDVRSLAGQMKACLDAAQPQPDRPSAFLQHGGRTQIMNEGKSPGRAGNFPGKL